jgi:hypothetical protein
MISAADVLAVATPSWKTNGLRSAKDLLQAVATVVVVAFDGIDDSAFVTASLAALLLVSRREFDEQSQVDFDVDVRFDSTRRDSVDVAIMVVWPITN